MKTLSKEIKRRIWKMIGQILRQDHTTGCNITMSWMLKVDEEGDDQRPPGGER